MAVKNSKENTRERIINSAKKLFAEQGYQKTTIVDISRQANLSEAALYEYFQGKEDLLLTIPDLWVSELLKDVDEQLFGIKGAANKLRKYLWWYLRRIEQAPLDAKIVYLFLKTNANFMTTEVYSNVKKLYSHLLEIFEEGRKTGEWKPDLNPLLARDIFVGTMDHIITRWLLKDMSYSIFENLDHLFELMIGAFAAGPSRAASLKGPTCFTKSSQEVFMKINKVDHICIAVKNLADARKMWEPVLGKSKPDDEYIDEPEKIKVARYWVGEVGFELMESTAADGDVAKFIEKRGEGVMLISFNVDNTRKAMDELQGKGYPFIGGARPFRDCEFAFVHPKKMNGVLLELIDYKWRELEKK